MSQAPLHDGFMPLTRDDVRDDNPTVIANHLRTFKSEVFQKLDDLETRIKTMFAGFVQSLSDLLAQQQLHTRRIDRLEATKADHERRITRLEKPPRKRLKRRGKKTRK